MGWLSSGLVPQGGTSRRGHQVLCPSPSYSPNYFAVDGCCQWCLRYRFDYLFPRDLAPVFFILGVLSDLPVTLHDWSPVWVGCEIALVSSILPAQQRQREIKIKVMLKPTCQFSILILKPTCQFSILILRLSQDNQFQPSLLLEEWRM